jgi:hypothetical protein
MSNETTITIYCYYNHIENSRFEKYLCANTPLLQITSWCDRPSKLRIPSLAKHSSWLENCFYEKHTPITNKKDDCSWLTLILVPDRFDPSLHRQYLYLYDNYIYSEA